MAMTLCLIGFQGAGKTTVGAVLSKHLRLPFHDLDQELSNKFHCSVPTLFQKVKETTFRELEHDLLQEFSSRPCVIACGGGVTNALSCLPVSVKSIYLFRPFHVVWDDISRRNTLPQWLDASSPFQSFEKCWKTRHLVFLTHAKHLVRVYKKSPLEDALRILSIL
jgi:shikimate kinase